MAANEPIDPRVRLAISEWPDDEPRGAVSTFCTEHGISRKSFYEVRKRVATEGPATPASRHGKPAKWSRPEASRYAVASHVARSETAQAAITVFDKAVAAHGVPQPAPVAVRRRRAASALQDLPDRTEIKTLTTAGAFSLTGVTYKVDGGRGLEQILVITDGDTIIAADLDGEILIEHTRPAPGVTYVGNGRPRGQRRKTDQTSPMS